PPAAIPKPDRLRAALLGWLLPARYLPASSLAIGPHRKCLADHGRCRNGSEISAVKRAVRLPIHDEDFVCRDQVASLPDRQWPAATIALARPAEVDTVDGYREPGSTHGLSRQRQDTFE